MKEKKHKYLEDLLDEYFQLTEEIGELLASTEKTQKKFEQRLSNDKDFVYAIPDAEDLFKFHNQLKKNEDRKKEINEELSDVENSLKEFLSSLRGGKVSFERKDDNDKSKSTYTFSLEGDAIVLNK